MFSRQLNKPTTRMSIQKTQNTEGQTTLAFGRRKQTGPPKKETKSPISVISGKEQILGLDPSQYTQKYYLVFYTPIPNAVTPGSMWNIALTPKYPNQTTTSISFRPANFCFSSVNSSDLPQIIWIKMSGVSGYYNNQKNFTGSVAAFAMSAINSTEYQGVITYNATYTCDDESTWNVPANTISDFTVYFDDDVNPILQLPQPLCLRFFVKHQVIG